MRRDRKAGSAPDYWGRGYATEAVHALDRLRLHRSGLATRCVPVREVTSQRRGACSRSAAFSGPASASFGSTRSSRRRRSILPAEQRIWSALKGLGRAQAGVLGGAWRHDMYQPPHFREERLDVCTHSFVRIPSAADPRQVRAGCMEPRRSCSTPIPSERGTTARAPCPRATRRCRSCAAVSECLVVFQGPQHCISPSLYPTKHETGKVVPTWNYITGQACGAPRVVDDADGWLRQQIGDLTRHQEGPRARRRAAGSKMRPTVSLPRRSRASSVTNSTRASTTDARQMEGQPEQAGHRPGRRVASRAPRPRRRCERAIGTTDGVARGSKPGACEHDESPVQRSLST